MKYVKEIEPFGGNKTFEIPGLQKIKIRWGVCVGLETKICFLRQPGQNIVDKVTKLMSYANEKRYIFFPIQPIETNKTVCWFTIKGY